MSFDLEQPRPRLQKGFNSTVILWWNGIKGRSGVSCFKSHGDFGETTEGGENTGDQMERGLLKEQK